MTDDRERELIHDTLEAAFSGDIPLAEGFSQTLAQHQQATPNTRRARVGLGDGTVKATPPGATVCPDCGKMFTWGAGLSFQDADGFLEELMLGAHRALRCRAFKWRWYRLTGKLWRNRLDRRRLRQRYAVRAQGGDR